MSYFERYRYCEYCGGKLEFYAHKTNHFLPGTGEREWKIDAKCPNEKWYTRFLHTHGNIVCGNMDEKTAKEWATE